MGQGDKQRSRWLVASLVLSAWDTCVCKAVDKDVYFLVCNIGGYVNIAHSTGINEVVCSRFNLHSRSSYLVVNFCRKGNILRSAIQGENVHFNTASVMTFEEVVEGEAHGVKLEISTNIGDLESPCCNFQEDRVLGR